MSDGRFRVLKKIRLNRAQKHYGQLKLKILVNAPITSIDVLATAKIGRRGKIFGPKTPRTDEILTSKAIDLRYYDSPI